MKEAAYYVHPSACVDEPCHIGTGTRIWHFCHVMQDARIGERCVYGPGPARVRQASEVCVQGCRVVTGWNPNTVRLKLGFEPFEFFAGEISVVLA